MRGVAFTTPRGDPLLRIYCDGRRGMVVERVGDQSRRLAVNPEGTGGTVLRAALPINGKLAAALKAGPAPIRVSVGEDSLLSVPPSPLVAMLAADCSKL